MFIPREIFIILLIINSFACDEEFDDIVTKTNSVIQFRISGYRNSGSSGLNKGCCGNITKVVCEPCRFYVVIYRKGVSRVTYQDIKKYTTVATFSHASEELYERYDQNILSSSSTYDQIQIFIYSFNNIKTPQETFPYIASTKYTTYLYEGAFGENNILELWAELILKPSSMEENYVISMVRIDSIYWKQYRDLEGECCNGNYDSLCLNECGFNAEWSVSYEYVEHTGNLLPMNNGQKQDLSITLVSDYSFDRIRNLDYYINIYSMKYKYIDYIKIPDIMDIPGVEYKIINAAGIFGNLIFNVSWMHNCQVHEGINCRKECKANFATEYCDVYTGEVKCLNGAIDTSTCTNFRTNCTSDICSNGGTCVLASGNAICNCLSGYSGKFCQDWQCDSRCNGNGLCIGPNKCRCNYPNTGKYCEEYPCEQNGINTCGEYGFCKIISGVEHCQCVNPLMNGKHCSKPICSEKCIFGVCTYIKKLNITRCVCNEFYEGNSCNILSKNINFNLKPTITSYALPLSLLILFSIIIIIVSVLAYTKKIGKKCTELTRYSSTIENLTSHSEG